MASAKPPTKAQLQAQKKKDAAAAAKASTAPAPAAASASFNMQTLAALVSATNSPAGFTFLTRADADPLVALGYAEIKDDMTGDAPSNVAGIQPGPGVAARSTPAGAAAVSAGASPFAAAAPAPVAAPAAPAAAPAAAEPAAPSAFKIVAGVPMPAAKRFGKASVYPFDALMVGASFFVPATKERDNPAKSMASTVNSATARYAVLDGKNADGSEKFKNTRAFSLRRIADGKDAGFGDEYAGVSGAGVWRTA